MGTIGESGASPSPSVRGEPQTTTARQINGLVPSRDTGRGALQPGTLILGKNTKRKCTGCGKKAVVEWQQLPLCNGCYVITIELQHCA